MQPAINLFCLPYAGGGSSIYRDWQAKMPQWINVIPLHMPARGVRHRMEPIHEWPALLDLFVADICPHLESPFAIFGHSMGALIGIELAQELRARFGHVPAWFGASACTAPTRRKWEDKWLDCSQEDILKEIGRRNGTADELLANTEFMALIAPMLRADFHLCGTHRCRGRLPIPCPILVLGGARDDEISKDGQSLLAWSREASGPFELAMLDGGHFFIDTHRDEVIGEVARSLTAAASADQLVVP